MTEIKTAKDLQGALENIDWKLSQARMLWSMNSPRCLCEPCYKDWLEWGKRVYKEQRDVYQKRVDEEELHRKSIQSSRELRERYPRT